MAVGAAAPSRTPAPAPAMVHHSGERSLEMQVESVADEFIKPSLMFELMEITRYLLPAGEIAGARPREVHGPVACVSLPSRSACSVLGHCYGLETLIFQFRDSRFWEVPRFMRSS
jgi:hypothetical protein